MQLNFIITVLCSVSVFTMITQAASHISSQWHELC